MPDAGQVGERITERIRVSSYKAQRGEGIV